MSGPDRPETRLAIPTRRSDLIGIGTNRSEPNYTVEQRSQIERLTQQYLKRNGLPVSYQFFTQILPTIRTLIEDGLVTIKQSPDITSSDNVTKAFDVALKQRQQTINKARELLRFQSYSDSHYGPYAIPHRLEHDAREELDPGKLPFRARVERSASFADLSEQRKPIFRQLLQYARHAAAQQIPGADKVELNEGQQAGLVRNLIFGWVTTGEAQVILEAEDFISGKNEYSQQLAAPDTQVLDQLAKAAKLNSPQAQNYLNDLAQQVAEMLDRIPARHDGALDFESVDRSFHSLKDNFAIVDPFYKLNAVSEDPSAEGRTIWDEGLCTRVVVDGQEYLVPLPQTLRILSYQLRPTNQARFLEVREAMNSVNQLLDRTSKAVPGQESEPLARQRERVQQAKDRLDDLGVTLRDGGIPDDLLITPYRKRSLINHQRKTMADELAFFSTTRRNIMQARLGAQQVLRDFGQRPSSEDGDFRLISGLLSATRQEMVRLQVFTRERLHKRIRSLEYLQLVRDPIAYANFRKSSRYSMSEHFNAAIETTIVDVLGLQTEIWRKDALESYGLTGDDTAKQLWERVLASQRAQVNDELFELAIKTLGRSRLSSILGDHAVSELLSLASHPDLDKLIRDNYPRIGSKIQSLQDAQKKLAEGQSPRLSLSADHPAWGSSRQDGYLTQASRTWNPKSRLTEELGDLSDTSLTPKEIDAVKISLKHQRGPAGIALRVLALLPNPTQLPLIGFSLNEFANSKDEPLYRTRFSSAEELDLSSDAEGVKQRLLAAIPKGADISKAAIDPLLTADLLRQVRKNSYLIAQFFGLETEVEAWYGLQTRLLDQQEQEPIILASRPLVDAVNEAKAAVQTEERKLRSWEIAYRSSVGNPLVKLQQAGLARRT